MKERESEALLEDFHSRFEVVFIDSSGCLNLCADMSKSTFEVVSMNCLFCYCLCFCILARLVMSYVFENTILLNFILFETFCLSVIYFCSAFADLSWWYLIRISSSNLLELYRFCQNFLGIWNSQQTTVSLFLQKRVSLQIPFVVHDWFLAT